MVKARIHLEKELQNAANAGDNKKNTHHAKRDALHAMQKRKCCEIEEMMDFHNHLDNFRKVLLAELHETTKLLRTHHDKRNARYVMDERHHSAISGVANAHEHFDDVSEELLAKLQEVTELLRTHPDKRNALYTKYFSAAPKKLDRIKQELLAKLHEITDLLIDLRKMWYDSWFYKLAAEKKTASDTLTSLIGLQGRLYYQTSWISGTGLSKISPSLIRPTQACTLPKRWLSVPEGLDTICDNRTLPESRLVIWRDNEEHNTRVFQQSVQHNCFPHLRALGKKITTIPPIHVPLFFPSKEQIKAAGNNPGHIGQHAGSGTEQRVYYMLQEILKAWKTEGQIEGGLVIHGLKLDRLMDAMFQVDKKLKKGKEVDVTIEVDFVIFIWRRKSEVQTYYIEVKTSSRQVAKASQQLEVVDKFHQQLRNHFNAPPAIYGVAHVDTSLSSDVNVFNCGTESNLDLSMFLAQSAKGEETIERQAAEVYMVIGFKIFHDCDSKDAPPCIKLATKYHHLNYTDIDPIAATTMVNDISLRLDYVGPFVKNKDPIFVDVRKEQRALKKWDKKKENIHSIQFQFLTHLTSEQAEILKDKTLKRICLIGPYGAGKTLLLLFKASELAESRKPVVVVATETLLEQRYKPFFEANLQHDAQHYVNTINSHDKDDLIDTLSEKSNVFYDEFFDEKLEDNAFKPHELARFNFVWCAAATSSSHASEAASRWINEAKLKPMPLSHIIRSPPQIQGLLLYLPQLIWESGTPSEAPDSVIVYGHRPQLILVNSQTTDEEDALAVLHEVRHWKRFLRSYSDIMIVDCWPPGFLFDTLEVPRSFYDDGVVINNFVTQAMGMEYKVCITYLPSNASNEYYDHCYFEATRATIGLSVILAGDDLAIDGSALNSWIEVIDQRSKTGDCDTPANE